jgi:hypothetical protein
MIAEKKLYFIPVIARALQSDDPRRALEEAFEEIRELGKRAEYQEGYQQFREFIKTALTPSDEASDERVRLLNDAIFRLLHDLATDIFEGDEEQEEALLGILRSYPEWDAEYTRIVEELHALFPANIQLRVEVLKGDRIIGSFPLSPDPAVIGSVTPGSYTVQFSNGRVLWKGELSKEALIWAYAFPGKDLAMAAETEVSRGKHTRTISLLGGEIMLSVFAGLESGQIRMESGKVD